MRDTFGTTVASSSSCLGDESSDELVSPAMLPPGRARLMTRPLPTGSVELAMTIGIAVIVRFKVGRAAIRAVTITSHKLRGDFGDPFVLSLDGAPLDDKILSFDISQVAHALYESSVSIGSSRTRHSRKIPDVPHLARLLGAPRKRPSDRCTSDECNEFPSPHGSPP